MFLDCESKCSKFGDVKDKAGKRLSHIRFSPYRGRLATREDSRAHPRGLPHCGKNAAKLAINADNAQLFLKISFKSKKKSPASGLQFPLISPPRSILALFSPDWRPPSIGADLKKHFDGFNPMERAR